MAFETLVVARSRLLNTRPLGRSPPRSSGFAYAFILPRLPTNALHHACVDVLYWIDRLQRFDFVQQSPAPVSVWQPHD
jgi:hypothetical protein